MAELTNDEIQYENARLTREQWKAEAEGTAIPIEVATSDTPTPEQ